MHFGPTWIAWVALLSRVLLIEPAVAVLLGGMALDRTAGINMAVGNTAGMDSDTISLESNSTNDLSLPSSGDSNSSTRQARAVGAKRVRRRTRPPAHEEGESFVGHGIGQNCRDGH